jgi:hypothetical protein
MTDRDPITFIQLRRPTQCVLWEHLDRVVSAFGEMFGAVDSTVIPAQTAKEILALKEATMFDLLCYWATIRRRSSTWIGKS